MFTEVMKEWATLELPEVTPEVYVSSSKITIIFLLFCIPFVSGFAMVFFMIFQNQSLFNSPNKSWMKTLVMSTGEMDYSGIFETNNDKCGG